MATKDEPTDDELAERFPHVAKLERHLREADIDLDDLPQREGTTRRELLQAAGVLGGGALLGGVGANELAGTARAGTNQVGTVGTAANPVDIEAEDVNADSVTTGELNDIITVSTGDNPQTRINDAGADGVLYWETGTHSISSSLSPADGQTWLMSSGAVLEPASDIVVVDMTNNVEVKVIGELHIADPSNNQTSNPAVLLDETVRCYFQRIWLDGVYTGLKTDAVNDGTKENVFGSIYATAIRNRGIWLLGQTHDNHFQSVWITGATGSSHGILIDTNSVDGGNMFDQVLSLDMDGDGIQVASLNREFWMGQVICDKASSNGFNHIAGANRAFFIDTLWASGNGSTGLRLSGTSSNSVNDGQIGQIHSIGNSAEGIILEHTDNIQIGRVLSEDNDDGLRLANGTSTNLYIGNIRTRANTTYDVDATDAGAGCRMQSIQASGTLNNITNLEVADGFRMSEDLTSRTGFDGEMAYHDGTDGNNTNDAEPAYWQSTASEWRGLYTGNVID